VATSSPLSFPSFMGREYNGAITCAPAANATLLRTAA
jgi:hypothetical protein